MQKRKYVSFYYTCQCFINKTDINQPICKIYLCNKYTTQILAYSMFLLEIFKVSYLVV